MIKIVYSNEEKKIFFEKDKEKIYKGIERELYKYIEKVNIDEKVFGWLSYLENIIIDNKNLEDFYIYDNIPLYYFERPTIYFVTKQILTYFYIIKNIKENVKDDMEIESDNDIFIYISNEVFNLKCRKIVGKKFNTKTTKHRIFKMLVRTLRGIKNYIKFKLKFSNKDNVLVLSNVMNINLLKIGNERKFIDTQIGPVVDKLKENFNVLNMQYMLNNDILDKSLHYKEEYIPFEFFIIYKKILGRKFIDRSLIKNELKNFKKIDFMYEGYNLKNPILKYVFNNLEERYILDLTEILCAEKFIKRHKIKKCILTDEGDRPRCFITAGNRQKIGTFAIQHGIINEVSPAYTINSKYNNIIPKCTFVWGERYNNMLKELSNLYRSSEIQVVGQVRTDYLINYLNKKNNNENNKIKVLYATQYLKDLLIPATDMLFNALSSMESEYEIIVKLHPADQYYDIYKSKAEEKKIKNIRIVKDGDLYELLDWCDVVVSVHSTVVVEGALLGKPSICIRLPKYDDEGGFIRDGLSIGVDNEFDLKNQLMHCKGKVLSDRTKKYLEYNFYKSDGKVSSRIEYKIKEISSVKER